MPCVNIKQRLRQIFLVELIHKGVSLVHRILLNYSNLPSNLHTTCMLPCYQPGSIPANNKTTCPSTGDCPSSSHFLSALYQAKHRSTYHCRALEIPESNPVNPTQKYKPLELGRLDMVSQQGRFQEKQGRPVEEKINSRRRRLTIRWRFVSTSRSSSIQSIKLQRAAGRNVSVA